MRSAALVALLALVATAACGDGPGRSSRSADTRVPTWVKRAADTAVRGKVGDAKPRAVRYAKGKAGYRVVYEFGRLIPCPGCHKPWDARVPRGRTAEVFVDADARSATSFTFRR